MKKIIAVLMILFCTLFTACAPANSLPYKVWADWDEMKEALGDHYLYPTYLPECTEVSEYLYLQSDYNYNPLNPKGDGTYDPQTYPEDDPYYGYWASFSSNVGSVNFVACDYGKMKSGTHEPVSKSFMYDGYETFHEITESINGIEVNFVTKYVEAGFTPTNIPTSSGRIVFAEFEYNGIAYSARLTQYDVGVDDKYADGEVKEELLTVATSIIEQGDK